MAQDKASQIHAELFEVRKRITALAKDQAATSQRMVELAELQERLEAELAALRKPGKSGD